MPRSPTEVHNQTLVHPWTGSFKTLTPGLLGCKSHPERAGGIKTLDAVSPCQSHELQLNFAKCPPRPRLWVRGWMGMLHPLLVTRKWWTLSSQLSPTAP